MGGENYRPLQSHCVKETDERKEDNLWKKGWEKTYNLIGLTGESASGVWKKGRGGGGKGKGTASFNTKLPFTVCRSGSLKVV